MEEDLLLPAEVKEWAEGKNEPLQRKQAEVSETHVTNATHPAEPPILNPKCLVHFRPNRYMSKYQGEYGFDWLRDEEDNEYLRHPIKVYKDAVESGYEKLVSEEYKSTHNFRVFWKKDAEGKPYTYYVSWLSILPGREATVDLYVEIQSPPKSLKFDYESDYLTLRADGITDIRKKGERYVLYTSNESKKGLTITCKTSFEEEKVITVYSDDNKNQICGKLVVVPNAKTYPMKITFVKVYIYEGDKDAMSKMKFDELKDCLENKSFNQALITCSFTEAIHELPLTGDTKLRKFIIKKTADLTGGGKKEIDCFEDGTEWIEHIHKAYINQRKLPQEKNELIYFYVRNGIPMIRQPNKEGEARIGRGSAFIYSWIKETSIFIDTNKHEGGHSLSLSHSFEKNGNSKHIFSEDGTDNIMDYSDNRVSFWKWQWRLMQQTLEEGFSLL